VGRVIDNHLLRRPLVRPPMLLLLPDLPPAERGTGRPPHGMVLSFGPEPFEFWARGPPLGPVYCFSCALGVDPLTSSPIPCPPASQSLADGLYDIHPYTRSSCNSTQAYCRRGMSPNLPVRRPVFVDTAAGSGAKKTAGRRKGQRLFREIQPISGRRKRLEECRPAPHELAGRELAPVPTDTVFSAATYVRGAFPARLLGQVERILGVRRRGINVVHLLLSAWQDFWLHRYFGGRTTFLWGSAAANRRMPDGWEGERHSRLVLPYHSFYGAVAMDGKPPVVKGPTWAVPRQRCVWTPRSPGAAVDCFDHLVEALNPGEKHKPRAPNSVQVFFQP